MSYKSTNKYLAILVKPYSCDRLPFSHRKKLACDNFFFFFLTNLWHNKPHEKFGNSIFLHHEKQEKKNRASTHYHHSIESAMETASSFVANSTG